MGAWGELEWYLTFLLILGLGMLGYYLWQEKREVSGSVKSNALSR